MKPLEETKKKINKSKYEKKAEIVKKNKQINKRWLVKRKKNNRTKDQKN